ncbi:MAG: serine/threonine protein kinase [Suilimivivens sp.]
MKQILCHKYEVLKVIAQGGMGIVYLVKDLHLNKLAAVKVSKNPEKIKEKEFVLREMEVLKELSHPALPGIVDFFEEGKNICLVMEYVEGITLEQYLRKFGRVEISLAVKWALELTEVLLYLHTCNPPIIYRDLKPANIMIQPDGKLKLIDFGAAFVASYGQEREQMMMGTPGYSAPEQWQNGKADKAGDIYGLGAVLHEMLTGITPRQLFAERRPVREYDKSIPRELEKIILVCTRKRPSERYQSMEQLREALQNYGKKGKGKEWLLHISRGIGAGLFFLAGARLLLPFLQGVDRTEFPFPYLREPLLLLGAAFLYQRLLRRKTKDRRILKRQEKSIFLTEKKFSGIYISGIFLFILAGVLMQGKGASLSVLAKEKDNSLWVEMRDEQNRKLLLKEGAVYQVNDRVKLEIPAERMPEGEIALKLVATGEDGEIYESRIFLLQGELKEE